MDGPVKKVLLIPRFTSYSGNGPFYTAPMNIRAYHSALLTAWRSAGVGSTPSEAAVAVEESSDLAIWTENPVVVTPLAGKEATEEVEFSLEWMRLRIGISGSPAGNTMWAVGNFVEREQ